MFIQVVLLEKSHGTIWAFQFLLEKVLFIHMSAKNSRAVELLSAVSASMHISGGSTTLLAYFPAIKRRYKKERATGKWLKSLSLALEPAVRSLCDSLHLPFSKSP